MRNNVSINWIWKSYFLKLFRKNSSKNLFIWWIYSKIKKNKINFTNWNVDFDDYNQLSQNQKHIVETFIIKSIILNKIFWYYEFEKIMNKKSNIISIFFLNLNNRIDEISNQLISTMKQSKKTIITSLKTTSLIISTKNCFEILFNQKKILFRSHYLTKSIKKSITR